MDEKEIEEKSEVKTEEVVTEVKKAAKKTITTAVIVKRTIQVILLIALIPILYFTIVTAGFSKGWFEYEGKTYNEYFTWTHGDIKRGWFKAENGKRLNDAFPSTQDYTGIRYYENGNSNGIIAYKPIIYIYPQNEIEMVVKLGKKENITCSYPKYKDGWRVKAFPDGTLIDLDTGKKLYSLYWEGKNEIANPNITTGFVVRGEDSADFLEEKLGLLGLNYREAEEFIVYWLPKLEVNKYNYIRFETIDEINKNMPLEISVKPDSIIRIIMEFKGLDDYIEVPEQDLKSPERTGFVVVEWGGTEL